MNEDDKQLIAEAKKEPLKYEKIYEKYANKVFNYFWYRTGHDKSLSEDLMQETFVRAYQHLDRFNNRGYSYFTYLLSIAHNILIDYYRKPRPILLEEAAEVPYEITRDLERRSDAEALWRAIQTLPKREQDIILMRYQDDMSIRDIATVVHCTENAAKLVLSRVRKKLQNHPYLMDMVHFTQTERQETPAKFM